MKKAAIVALVCINLALFAALIAVNAGRAEAQTLRGGNDYIMVTGKTQAGVDAVYVIDMKTRRLAGWRFDINAKRLLPYKGKNLETDFGGKP